ncbi:MAG TPA: hypothetical protein VFE46_19380 [Pirellulales bacterium]|jgi:hypothetical protein|nr:hypothetical protein [Pirellulales bacterium]
MLSFHTTVHARRAEITAGPEINLHGRKFCTLSATPEALAATFPVSFEEAGAALEKLERLHFEPDGSFVWVSARDEAPWQVDGNLFDRAGRLLFVDLKGTCPSQQLDQLLAAFGWPQCVVMFQLLREAVFLNEADFRRYAAGD